MTDLSTAAPTSAEMWPAEPESEDARSVGMPPDTPMAEPASTVLARLATAGWRTLDDRLATVQPRVVIDHVAVGPGGIFTIDNHSLAGSGPDFSVISDANQPAKLATAQAAADAIRALLPPLSRQYVVAVLAFADSSPMSMSRGPIQICTTSMLQRVVDARRNVLSSGEIDEIVVILDSALRPAGSPARSVASSTVPTPTPAAPAVSAPIEEPRPKPEARRGRRFLGRRGNTPLAEPAATPATTPPTPTSPEVPGEASNPSWPSDIAPTPVVAPTSSTLSPNAADPVQDPALDSATEQTRGFEVLDAAEELRSDPPAPDLSTEPTIASIEEAGWQSEVELDPTPSPPLEPETVTDELASQSDLDNQADEAAVLDAVVVDLADADVLAEVADAELAEAEEVVADVAFAEFADVDAADADVARAESWYSTRLGSHLRIGSHRSAERTFGELEHAESSANTEAPGAHEAVDSLPVVPPVDELIRPEDDVTTEEVPAKNAKAEPGTTPWRELAVDEDQVEPEKSHGPKLADDESDWRVDEAMPPAASPEISSSTAPRRPGARRKASVKPWHRLVPAKSSPPPSRRIRGMEASDPLTAPAPTTDRSELDRAAPVGIESSVASELDLAAAVEPSSVEIAATTWPVKDDYLATDSSAGEIDIHRANRTIDATYSDLAESADRDTVDPGDAINSAADEPPIIEAVADQISVEEIAETVDIDRHDEVSDRLIETTQDTTPAVSADEATTDEAIEETWPADASDEDQTTAPALAAWDDVIAAHTIDAQVEAHRDVLASTTEAQATHADQPADALNVVVSRWKEARVGQSIEREAESLPEEQAKSSKARRQRRGGEQTAAADVDPASPENLSSRGRKMYAAMSNGVDPALVRDDAEEKKSGGAIRKVLFSMILAGVLVYSGQHYTEISTWVDGHVNLPSVGESPDGSDKGDKKDSDKGKGAKAETGADADKGSSANPNP